MKKNAPLHAHTPPIAAPIPILAEPATGLWFKHASARELSRLRPLSYQELALARPDYDAQARRRAEMGYKRALGESDPEMGLLYATVVGANAMESARVYLGYTYFFQLSDEQIEGCLFDVVDHRERMKPTLGRLGLDLALSIWRSEKESLRGYDEPGLGRVEPRVEVVIPFAVSPVCYIPQLEDRALSGAPRGPRKEPRGAMAKKVERAGIALRNPIGRFFS